MALANHRRLFSTGVESHLRQIAVSSNPTPNYHRPLREYPTFDWHSIGATVLNWDDDGVTAISCRQHLCRLGWRQHTEEQDEDRDRRNRPHRGRLLVPAVEEGEAERVWRDGGDAKTNLRGVIG